MTKMVISPEEHERMRREDEADWALLDGVAEQNADQGPDEVLRDVTAAVEQGRPEPGTR